MVKAGKLTQVIAHRGDSAHCPENTAAAFTSALRAPIDGIELDLRIAGGGEVVVCHDENLRRFGGPRIPVARQTVAQLKKIDIGGWFAKRFAAERTVTLAELLDRFGRKTTLLLELKPEVGIKAAAANRKLFRTVARELDRRSLSKRVRILCFDPRALTAMASLDDRLPLVRNHERVPKAIERWLDEQADHHGFCCDQRALGHLARKYVGAVHQRGQKMYSYTCNTPAAARRALIAGVDGVLGDDPFWLAKFVQGLRR